MHVFALMKGVGSVKGYGQEGSGGRLGRDAGGAKIALPPLPPPRGPGRAPSPLPPLGTAEEGPGVGVLYYIIVHTVNESVVGWQEIELPKIRNLVPITIAVSGYRWFDSVSCNEMLQQL